MFFFRFVSSNFQTRISHILSWETSWSHACLPPRATPFGCWWWLNPWKQGWTSRASARSMPRLGAAQRRREQKIALEDIGRRQARKNAIKIVAKMDKKFASGEGKKSKFQEKKILAANLKTKKRNCVDHLKCHSTRLLEREIFSLKFKQH